MEPAPELTMQLGNHRAHYRDPYKTGRLIRGSFVHGQAFKSIATTSWTPKELHGRPLGSSKVQYLNTASALNLAVSQRLGDSRPGLSLAGARTTTGATYTGHDAAALSQPPSAVLERLVDALLKPVASQTLHPALAPLPSDQSRSHETHRPHTAAAVAQHRLRTFSKSSALLGLGEALDAPPADGESELTKARFMYLRNGDGGRSVIQLRYADEPAGDDALPVAALPDVAPPARFQSTTQTPGGYRPRTASEYTRGALAMRFDGAQTLSAMRKLAPDYLVGPAHPRRKMGATPTLRPQSALGPAPLHYVLVSDDYENLPDFMRTSKAAELGQSRPATAFGITYAR